MHLAIGNGYFETALLLFQKGADIRTTNKYGEDPFKYGSKRFRTATDEFKQKCVLLDMKRTTLVLQNKVTITAREDVKTSDRAEPIITEIEIEIEIEHNNITSSSSAFPKNDMQDEDFDISSTGSDHFSHPITPEGDRPGTAYLSDAERAEMVLNLQRMLGGTQEQPLEVLLDNADSREASVVSMMLMMDSPSHSPKSI